MFSRLRALTRPTCRPRFFDPVWYRAAYADVATAGMDPLRHYLRHGRAEGRLPCFMVTAARERDMRWGLAPEGAMALARFARGTVPDQTEADRIWAALALARAAGRRGAWAEAAEWLEGLSPKEDLIEGYGLPDHSLLAIEVWSRTGTLSRAHNLLDLAFRQFGPLPDLRLAEANLAAAEHGVGARWAKVMTNLYQSAGLVGVTADRSEFDALRGVRISPVRRAKALVSIIMPARDAEETIEAALRSLIQQSWPALEVIVVDNGSRDGTAGIVRRFAAEDPRITLLDGAAEPGTYAARNLGVAQARGALITVLDADDWAHPQRIERQARALLKAPKSVVATISDWVRVTPTLTFTRWWREDGLVHRDVSSLMIRSEARVQLGFWDRTRAGADTEYIARLEARFGPHALRAVLPGIPLSFGRTRADSLTQTAETSIDTQLFGARRDYDLASRRWHGRMQGPLPQYPERRPFTAPRALGLEPPDPAAEKTPQEWVTQSGMFDGAWMMQTYAVLRAAEVDPVRHYEAQTDGQSPGPGFSPSAYAMAHGPINGSALRHYVQHGHDPLPAFPGALTDAQDTRNILVFGHQAGPEIFGAERCLIDLLNRAIAAGVTPSVVLPQIQNAAYLEALQARSRAVHIRPYGWLFGDVPTPEQTVQDLATLIRDTQAKEVHQNTAVLEAPLRAARHAGVPSVVHVHELPEEDPQLCMGLGLTASELRARILNLADKLVANTQPVQDWLNAPGRALLVPNRIDASLFDLGFTPQNPLRVGLIGSLVAKKGVQDVATLAHLVPQAQFVLIGPNTEDIRRLAPLPGNVKHTGYASSPAEAITQCDIVLSLSHFAESFGRTVLEAMAAGRPVLCYDRGVPPELVGRDGAAGRVTAANTPEAAAEALRDMLFAPGGLTAMSSAARLRAKAYQADAECRAQALFTQAGFSAVARNS